MPPDPLPPVTRTEENFRVERDASVAALEAANATLALLEEIVAEYAAGNARED